MVVKGGTMDNWSGRTLKGYQLIERIGAGGFGAVYRARQSTIDREVAVKIILPGFANQPDFIRRFETEAQVIARLEHPYITPLYDYWRDPQGAYLVMRWLRGGSLHTALKDGPFDLAAAALLIDQVCSALALAHRCGIIHRDLKPGNILLDEDGNAYLADFGIAKVLRDISAGLTKPDDIVGSLDYISPEQARGEPVTPCTDIYSLGVVLYEVLTGEHPFPNCSAVERLYKHINDPLPVIEKLDPVVRDEINAIIQRATAKDPAHRYPDVLALAVAFREGVRPVVTPSEQNIVEQLTYREQEILQCIADGLSNKEIANNLFISEPTVKWHIRQVYRKLGVRSRVQAVIRARELDLIVSGERDESGRVSGATTSSTGLPEPENPYKGLLAFQPADHLDFFGREELIDKLVGRMAENHALGRFLAVIGPSGSGKSSLVKAGLIPALWAGKLPGSEKWFVVDMLPGAHPLDELEVALTRLAANQAGNLREQLARDERGLLRAAGLILPGDGSELVLIVDQFEELFTLVNENDERIQFMNLLRTAVTETRSRVRVVITLRADFYDRPLRYPEFGELVRQRMETLLPLTAKGLERAIAGPAQRVGIRLEEGLVATIVGEMNYQAGALPLLQYALTELFERRDGRRLTNQAYHEIGGAVGALAKRADEVYLSLDAVGQELTRQMFLRLVTLGEGTTDTRRRTPRSELLAIAPEAGHDGHGSTDLIDEIIDTYAAYRLLLLDHDPATRTPTVEVAHEAILLEWERLREWLNDCREEIRWQRQLAQMAREWHTGGRDVSFLLRGARLEQFAGWAAETQMALTRRERAFLETSIHEQQRREQDEQLRQQQELETQRQLAEQRQRAATNLRNLVIALSVFLVAALGLSLVAVDREQQAQEARAEAEREAATNHSLVLASDAEKEVAAGRSDLGLALALEAAQGDNPPAEVVRTLSEVAFAPGTRAILRESGNEIRAVAFSPDSQYGISGSCAVLEGDTCTVGEIALWDLTTYTEVRRYEGHTGWVNALAFTPDGQAILSGSDDGTLILWDVQTGNIIRRYEGHTAAVNSLAVSKDGLTAVSGGEDNLVLVWDVASGAILHRLEGHSGAVNVVLFSPDEQTILSGSDDTTIVLWDVGRGEILSRLENSARILSAAFSPDGTFFVAAVNKMLARWDMPSREAQIASVFEYVPCLLMSPDGQYLMICNGTSIKIWSGVKWDQELYRLDDHHDLVEGRYIYINTAAVDSQSKKILTGTDSGSIRLWNLSVSGQIGSVETDYDTGFTTISISQGMQYIAGGGYNCDAVVWNYTTREEISHFGNENGAGLWAFVDLSPDGTELLMGCGNWAGSTESPILTLWDTKSGTLIRRLEGHQYNIRAVEFSPDGRTALVSSQQYVTGAAGLGELFLWDLETGRIIRSFVDDIDVTGIDFNVDGTLALTTSAFGQDIILWDIATGEQIRRFTFNVSTMDIVFGPDETTALAATTDARMILVDLQTGESLRQFIGHQNNILTVEIASNGKYAVSREAYTGLVILWNFNNGEILQYVPAGGRAVPTNVAFSPDSQTIWYVPASPTGNFGNNMIQWRVADLSLDELLAWIPENRYVRDFTCEERAQYRIEPLCEVES